MAIISNLDRRTMRGRLMMLLIYGVLFTGSIGMIYPFLLMVRMTTSDAVDRESISPIPEFFWDRDLYARKALNQQYRLTPQRLVANAYGTDAWTRIPKAVGIWKTSLQPYEKVSPEHLQARINDYFEYAGNADLRFVLPALRFSPAGDFDSRFVSAWLAQQEGVPRETYRYFEPVKPDFNRRDWTPPYGENWSKWTSWLSHLPGSDRFIVAPSWIWQQFLKEKYRNDLEALRSAHGIDYASFVKGPRFTVTPPAPATPALLADWDDFVRNHYPLFWQNLPDDIASAASAQWQQWLATKVGVTDASAWTEITGLAPEIGYHALPTTMPPDETAAVWWSRFVANTLPASSRILASSEVGFSAFLAGKYKTPEALSKAWGTSLATFDDAWFPVAESDFQTLTKHPVAIKWELATQNFVTVSRSLITEGRAFYNTFVIVALSVITSLTINPLAAYALSRFRMRGSHKILIFLLATLALPGEVALVPGFLLVRDLNLTDTYWALVLPGAANAFGIFLLKGFFDSLPQELYEAALIDGANEFVLFTRITIPLSMPILAVILLGTVTNAYNLFMPAVMYLGDVQMWPVATKIYEINQTQSAGVGMAALVISSIFPLLVFIFCQRIIMRGIILPSTK